jgi:hypothetical protein
MATPVSSRVQAFGSEIGASIQPYDTDEREIVDVSGGHGCARGHEISADRGCGRDFLPVAGGGHGCEIWVASAGVGTQYSRASCPFPSGLAAGVEALKEAIRGLDADIIVDNPSTAQCSTPADAPPLPHHARLAPPLAKCI